MKKSFEAKLRCPADMKGEQCWAFVILPKSESERFTRRGRTGLQGKMNGCPFEAILEPDGQLSHWFKVPDALMKQACVAAGDTVTLEVAPRAEELEPQLPPELKDLLDSDVTAMATWHATTTIARIDWIHWIESAKQARTRMSRTADACDMLASGKKRVCCFDPSGFYSKSMSAPREAK